MRRGVERPLTPLFRGFDTDRRRPCPDRSREVRTRPDGLSRAVIRADRAVPSWKPDIRLAGQWWNSMTDLIRYDLLVQDALRGVVRQVLSDVARNGLQGEHHFFITFKTAAPGLRLSSRMRERYPDEMTVILQHQFWGLTITEAGFEVGLSFNNMPERLFVPFASITMFQDPSVTFGLKFDPKDTGSPADAAQRSSTEPSKPTLAEAPKSLRALTTVENSVPARFGDGVKQGGDDKPNSTEKRSSDKPRPVLAKVEEATDGDAAGDAGTKVVSIDAFRKKP